MLLSVRRLATRRTLNMGTPSSRTYALRFSTDYDYNYDPDGTRTPPNYKLDPYTPEYCATPPPSSSPTYSSAMERLESVKRRSLSPKARSKSPAPVVPPTPTTPTPEYLAVSKEPSEVLETPGKLRKLLLLDLNGTLVYRSPHKPRNFAPRRPGKHQHHRRDQAAEEGRNWDPYADPTVLRPLRTVHGRPYLNSFRDYLFHPKTKEWLDTMVWSSAQPHSVADMVDKSFGDKKDELVAIWARDTLGLSSQDYNRKSQTTKDLAKPWASLPLSTSTPEGTSEPPQRHSARTSLLLDDSPLKAHLQPWNHLCIKEYTGEMRNNDLATNAREAALERAVAYNEAPPTDSAAPAEVSPALQAENADAEAALDANEEPVQTTVDEAMDQRLDRRLEKKKRKREARKATLDAVVGNPDLHYDSTLLAVIGVLDAVKHQSNVAGWMRGGALKLAIDSEGKDFEVKEPEVEVEEGKGKGKTKAKGAPLVGTESTDSLASTSGEPKKRRVGEDEAAAVDAVASVEQQDVTAPASPPGTGAATPLSNIGDTGQWFEDKEIVEKWVKRGVKALEELGIEVESGIVSHGSW